MIGMKIIELDDEVYYIPNPANIGIIGDSGKGIFIDTGIDDDTAKKATGLMQEKGLTPSMIVNTHSHADHCGGNRWIQNNHQVLTIAPDVEAGIIEYPALEPIYFFSGAFPIKELEHKMFKARPSKVDEIYDESRNSLFHRKVEFVPLYGHSPKQMGVGVNGVLFCADSVFSEDVLTKHKIPFHVNIDAEKRTLSWLRASGYNKYVPAHGEPFGDIDSVVDSNLRAIESVESYIRDGLHGKNTTSDIIRYVCDHFGVRIERISQYYLMNTTVMAYLSYLNRKGDLLFSVHDNIQYWHRL